MSITTTLLRSRVVEALASPHGVDRYLEIVNPMWAAREVRARIVDIRREVDVAGHPPVASTSNWVSTCLVPSAQSGSSPSPVQTPSRATASPSRCVRTRRAK
jgi:hypothetical protein